MVCFDIFYIIKTYLNFVVYDNIRSDNQEDLKAFKVELLSEIKQIIQPQSGTAKQWLKSAEVRKILSISPGTLQNLRINGTLRFTKIGGMMYYKLEDIHKILEGNAN